MVMSALPLKADVCGATHQVCFGLSGPATWVFPKIS
jgi:hypothetical protein